MCLFLCQPVSQFSLSVLSDSLRPHGLQHARLPCPSPTWSLPKLMSIESVMPSNHLIFCPNRVYYRWAKGLSWFLHVPSSFSSSRWADTNSLQLFLPFCTPSVQFSSVQFSSSVVSDSLRPHESQHARPRCPSPTPGVDSNSSPQSQWCHPTISSSVIPFSSRPQYFLASVLSIESYIVLWIDQLNRKLTKKHKH